MAFAPCASAGGDGWFPEPCVNPTAAKRVCRRCPYTAPCALGAIERGERWGVWGGLSVAELRQLARTLAVSA